MMTSNDENSAPPLLSEKRITLPIDVRGQFRIPDQTGSFVFIFARPSGQRTAAGFCDTTREESPQTLRWAFCGDAGSLLWPSHGKSLGPGHSVPRLFCVTPRRRQPTALYGPTVQVCRVSTPVSFPGRRIESTQFPSPGGHATTQRKRAPHNVNS